MNEYIAVDWGSTQLRAWRMRDGECIDKLKLPCGVTRLNGQRAEAVFQQQLAPWRGDPALPVVMAGMIGSDAGWQPVPYLACPLALEALNGQLYEVAEKVWIVPGLKVAHHAVLHLHPFAVGAGHHVTLRRHQLPGAQQLRFFTAHYVVICSLRHFQPRHDPHFFRHLI